MSTIVERSIRMGTADFTKAANTAKDFTIGFEFEMAVDDSATEELIYDLEQEFQNDYIQPTLSYYVFNELGIRRTARLYNLAPRYGWATPWKELYTSSKKGDTLTIYDIISFDYSDINDFSEYFTFDSEADMDALIDAYQEYAMEDENQRLHEFISNYNNTDNVDTEINNAFAYANRIFEPIINQPISIHDNRSDSDHWRLVSDSTIEPMGVELVSPPLPLMQGLAMAEKVLDAIREDDYLDTNESTGLHINIGINDPEHIDLLKLLLIMNEKYILQQFGRQDNTYTTEILPELVDDLISGNTDNLSTIITQANENLRQLAHKFSTVNILKLSQGYLEFRASGGDYSTKFKEIKDTALRYVRAIILASDPNAERQAYIKKLQSLITSPVGATTKDNSPILSVLEYRLLYNALAEPLNAKDSQSPKQLFSIIENDRYEFQRTIDRLAANNVVIPDKVAPIMAKWVRSLCELFGYHPDTSPFRKFS